MVAQFLTYLKEGFAYTGIEISGSEDDRSYFLLELKKSKNQLHITNKKELFALEELPELITKKSPLLICINTPNVLTKKIENYNGESIEALVNQAFPNIDLNSIYYEVAQANSQPIISISKRAPIDNLIKKIQNLQLHIFGFSLGISSIEYIVPFLEEGKLQVTQYEIQILDNVITKINSAPIKETLIYTISELELSSSYLLSFSQLLGNLNSIPLKSNFIALNENLQWEFNNFRIFNQVVKYALLFFIGLLLINFLVFNHYHEKVSVLNETLSATSSQKEELTLLEEAVNKKQERVETLSASANSKATFYLDLFAKQIPHSILLNEIKYQPLAKPIREKKPIVIEEGKLLVSGISKNVDAFSIWIEEMEKNDWVNSVETLDYNYVGKTSSNFLIEIGFHENR